MNQQLLKEIEQMRKWNATRLRRRYLEVFGEASRSGHREYLFRKLAWRLQSLAEGDLTSRARRRAVEIADDNCLRVSAPVSLRQAEALRRNHSLGIAAGTVLTRRYRNQTIAVKVVEDGFEYEGQRYRSLSAIAREVTGTQWNGKLFFGVAKAGR
jgi:hypothetical protein